MERRMKFRTLAWLSLLFIGGGASAANITYDVDLTIGSGTVVGAITTNGTVGELSRSDFESWSLTLTDAAIIGMPQTLTQTNSVLAFFGPSGAALTTNEFMKRGKGPLSTGDNLVPAVTAAGGWQQKQVQFNQ